MKTAELTTGTMMFVEVPNESTRYQLSNEDDFVMFIAMTENGKLLVRKDFSLGNWQLLGSSNELTEEQLKEVIPIKNITSSCFCEHCGYDIDCYRDFVNQTDNEWVSNPIADSLTTALESFKSLKLSLGIIDVNNLVFDPTGVTTGEWQAEQEKVKKYVVLFKNKQ